MNPARAGAAALAAISATAALFAPGVCRGDGETGGFSADFGRYEVIAGKSPFGAPPPSSGSARDPEGDAAAAAAAAQDANGGGAEAVSPLKMSSVSRFGGVPAAGFVENGTGIAFLLRPGENYGGYRLVDLDLDVGAAVVARGTNEWLVSLEWAPGQPTNVVPSAHGPYYTAFRPDFESAPGVAAEIARNSGGGEMPPTPRAAPRPAGVEGADGESGVSAGFSAEITPEEEAELVARATVEDPDGSTHLSFREFNRLRAKLRREKAAKARELELEAAERRAREIAAARAAAEEREQAENRRLADAMKRERQAIIAAIAQGYDVGEDIELTEDEAEELRMAGFQVPESP